MEEATHTRKRHTEKLEGFMNFRLLKADRVKLEVVTSGKSLGSTLRGLIDEAYNGLTEAVGELARLREKKKLLQGGSW